MKDRMPLGGVSKRPLHFIWVVDCSGSMMGEKIGRVNNAIDETLPAMRKAAEENFGAQVKMRALQFSTGASWIDSDWVNLENYSWKTITVSDTVTDIGEAFKLLAAELSIPPMPERALPPVIVLLSDGLPTDNYKPQLKKFLALPWAKKAVRVAIGIGSGMNAEVDEDKVLETFTGNKELVLHASNPEALTRMIKWASTLAATVSSGATSVGEPVDSNTDEGKLVDRGINPEDIPQDEGSGVW